MSTETPEKGLEAGHILPAPERFCQTPGKRADCPRSEKRSIFQVPARPLRGAEGEREEREFRKNISWITVNRATVKMHPVKIINVINDITPFQQAVEAVEQQIPIIANGGFIRPTQVLAIIRNLHLSGVMIGRGALGYPSFFQKILDLNKGNGKKIQLNEKERFIHGLRAFLEKIYYYATHGQGRWTTLGELKRQLYPFIKFKYSSEKGGLPTGYGFDKWHKKYDSICCSKFGYV